MLTVFAWLGSFGEVAWGFPPIDFRVNEQVDNSSKSGLERIKSSNATYNVHRSVM